MRLFTAIDLPDAMRQRLVRFGHGLPGCRPVPESQLHLTLVFIGEVNPALKRDITSALVRVEFPPFELRCGGIGSFRSGVLWIGVQPAAELLALQRAIMRQLRPLSAVHPERRKYRPHITLARMDRRAAPPPRALIEQHSSISYSFRVDEFVLKSSQLSPDGARHRIEQHFGSAI